MAGLARSDLWPLAHGHGALATQPTTRPGTLVGNMRSPIWPSEPSYPANLRRLAHPPPLHCRGRVTSGDARSVALVGTRTPSPAGVALAGTLAAQLARDGVTVVSGLARGIDTVAHEACLDAGGRSLAVLGCGVFRVYPPENAGLADRVAEHGAVLSDLPPDAAVSLAALRRRNALIAGLSLVTVVVEAGSRSGARITAVAALHLGGPLFLTGLAAGQGWARELLEQPGVFTLAVADGARPLLDLVAPKAGPSAALLDLPLGWAG